VRPSGGCVGFVHFLRGSVEAFCQNLVEKTGVLLMPASIYDASTEHFRIGFGRRNMPAALNQLKKYLEMTH